MVTTFQSLGRRQRRLGSCGHSDISAGFSQQWPPTHILPCACEIFLVRVRCCYNCCRPGSQHARVTCAAEVSLNYRVRPCLKTRASPVWCGKLESPVSRMQMQADLWAPGWPRLHGLCECWGRSPCQWAWGAGKVYTSQLFSFYSSAIPWC